MLAFKIIHRRGADRTPHCLAPIKHREINDHPIEVVSQYFTSLQWHCKTSVLKGSNYDHVGLPCAIKNKRSPLSWPRTLRRNMIS
jgi:hypothetical protein